MTAEPDSNDDSANARPRQGLAVWIATGAGVGFIGKAPGTFGAIWGLPLAFALSYLPWPVTAAVIIVLAAVGVPLCTAAARQLGRKDPGQIVWDEIVSVPMTFFLVPTACWFDPVTVALGFALNRVFDISKAPPGRQLERLPDGLGIMADDWAAGVYSCLALHVLVWLNVLPVVVQGA